MGDTNKVTRITSKSSVENESAAAVQLMAALSMLQTIPDPVRFGEYICETLKKLPPIDKCAVCLRGTDLVIGDSSAEPEKLMVKVSLISKEQPHFSFALPENGKRKVFLLGAPDRTFGYVFLDVKAPAKLGHIEAIIQRFINVAASELVRSWHSSELLKLRNQLIQIGEERGSELLASKPGSERTDDKLKDSEECFRVLYDGSPDMYVSVCAEDANIILCNETLLKKTGYKKDEVIGFPIFKMYHKDCLDEVKEVFNEFVETGEVLARELVLQRKDGSKMEVSLNAKAVRDKSGKVLRSISTWRDIGYELQVREKIQSYQKLFENSINEIYIVDMESYRFIEVNRAAIKNLGFTVEEMRGKAPYDIDSDIDKEKFEELVRDIKNSNREGSSYTATHKRKDGSTYPVEVYIQLSQYLNSPVIVAFVLDITDRVNAEKALEIHRDQLEETIKQRTQEFERQSKKLEESQLALTYLLEDMGIARQKMEETNTKLIDANKELESFSYSVSHDLRAPLRAIVGFSSKFEGLYNQDVDDEGKRLLNVISKNAMKMGRLIDDLLTFSRMSRTEIRKLNVHMRSLADEAWQEVYEQASDRIVRIEIENLPDVRGDRNMLKQVFVNIFSNAIKFSKPAEPNLIKVGASLEKGRCNYYIEDNGVGFDMKFIEKLFQVFQRLHSETEFEGTGVGLAIVKRIIKKHDGEVWAESELDKGAKFSFSLPV